MRPTAEQPGSRRSRASARRPRIPFVITVLCLLGVVACRSAPGNGVGTSRLSAIDTLAARGLSLTEAACVVDSATASHGLPPFHPGTSETTSLEAVEQALDECGLVPSDVLPGAVRLMVEEFDLKLPEARCAVDAIVNDVGLGRLFQLGQQDDSQADVAESTVTTEARYS